MSGNLTALRYWFSTAAGDAARVLSDQYGHERSSWIDSAEYARARGLAAMAALDSNKDAELAVVAGAGFEPAFYGV